MSRNLKLDTLSVSQIFDPGSSAIDIEDDLNIKDSHKISFATGDIVINRTLAGEPSIAIGRGTTSDQNGTVGIGNGATADKNYAIAIGTGATSTSTGITSDGIAIGKNANSGFEYNIAIGTNAKTSDSYSNQIAIGRDAGSVNLYNRGDIAIGEQSLYNKNDGFDATVAVGRKAGYYATSAYGVFIGEYAGKYQETGNHIFIGINTETSDAGKYNNNKVVIGNSARCIGYNGVSVGNGAECVGNNNVSIGSAGYSTRAYGDHSVAIGNSAYSAVKNVVIGSKASSTQANSIVIGYGANANGDGGGSENCVIIGYKAKSINGAPNSIAIGTSSSPSASGVAIGHNASVNGEYSIAIGANATVSEANCIVIGRDSITSGIGRIVLGTNCTSIGDSLSVPGAIAIGNDVTSGNIDPYNSYFSAGTVGIGNDVTATGRSSVAIGSDVTSTGNACVSVGRSSFATGDQSSAFGIGARVTQKYGLALGRCAHVVGPGQGSIAIGHAVNSLLCATVPTGDSTIGIGNGVNVSVDKGLAIGQGANVTATTRSFALNIHDDSIITTGAPHLQCVINGDDREIPLSVTQSARIIIDGLTPYTVAAGAQFDWSVAGVTQAGVGALPNAVSVSSTTEFSANYTGLYLVTLTAQGSAGGYDIQIEINDGGGYDGITTVNSTTGPATMTFTRFLTSGDLIRVSAISAGFTARPYSGPPGSNQGYPVYFCITKMV